MHCDSFPKLGLLWRLELLFVPLQEIAAQPCTSGTSTSHPKVKNKNMYVHVYIHVCMYMYIHANTCICNLLTNLWDLINITY